MNVRYKGIELGKNVRIIRDYEGKGLREAAKDIGISVATLSRIENGGVPDILSLWKVCNYIGQPMDKWFQRDIKMKGEK